MKIKQLLPTIEKLSDSNSKMVQETTFNPFNITTDWTLNSNLSFGEMSDVFCQEMENILSKLEKSMTSMIPSVFDRVMDGYTFNMLESYYKNAGFIPKIMMDEILEQIYFAAKKSSYGSFLDDFPLDKFMYKQYYNMTHRS